MLLMPKQKKPKPLIFNVGQYKGAVFKANLSDCNGKECPNIESDQEYTTLGELIDGHTQNAKELSAWLLEWSSWAESVAKKRT